MSVAERFSRTARQYGCKMQFSPNETSKFSCLNPVIARMNIPNHVRTKELFKKMVPVAYQTKELRVSCPLICTAIQSFIAKLTFLS